MIPFSLFFENALGLIDTVTFSEIGPVEAKVDSGNGAYNVLHGTNIDEYADYVKFTTVNNKVITKKLQEYIKINIGSGNIENRPVVLFDIKLGDKSYPNTAFSIANREQNEEKVLLGKTFIEKMGGIIDVTQKNIVS